MFAVESKRKSKQEIFGREMAERFHKGQPMPALVQIDDSDEGIIVQLKKLISTMTTFESYGRNCITGVETHLRSIQGNISGY